jgi:hypothetical protein
VGGKKMIFDIQSRISEYLELIEAIREQVDDPATVVAILHELRNDMRAEEMRQTKNYTSTGVLPATDAQLSYLKKLGGHVTEHRPTRNQASKMIGELQLKKPVLLEKMPMRIP